MNKLYHIISTMGRTQKAHFKKYGFRKEGSGTPELALFDIISKALGNGSEGMDMQVDASYARLTGRNDLPKMQSRLFQAVTSSISDHDRSRHDVHGYMALVMDSRTLASNGLAHEGRKLLHKGLAVAAEEEKPHWELVLYKELSAIESRHGDHRAIMASIEGQLAALDKVRQLTLLAKYYEMAFHIHRTIGQQRDRNEEVEGSLLEIQIRADELDLLDCPASARFNRIMLSQVIAHTLHRNDEALFHTEAAFNLIQEHPALVKGRELVPIALLSNLVCDGLANRNAAYYHRHVSRLRNWPCADQAHIAYRDAQVLKAEITAALYLVMFSKWRPLSEMLDSRKDEMALHSWVSLMGQVVHLAFADLAYRPCIRMVTKLLGLLHEHQRQDLISSLEILLVVVHYERGYLDTVDQLLRSIGQRLSMDGIFTDAEQELLVLLKLLAGSSTDSERKELLSRSLERMEQMQKDRPMGYFDPLIWVRSKLTKASYSDTFCKTHGLPIAVEPPG
jgi:hypothetical protein